MNTREVHKRRSSDCQRARLQSNFRKEDVPSRRCRRRKCAGPPDKTVTSILSQVLLLMLLLILLSPLTPRSLSLFPPLPLPPPAPLALPPNIDVRHFSLHSSNSMQLGSAIHVPVCSCCFSVSLLCLIEPYSLQGLSLMFCSHATLVLLAAFRVCYFACSFSSLQRMLLHGRTSCQPMLDPLTAPTNLRHQLPSSDGQDWHLTSCSPHLARQTMCLDFPSLLSAPPSSRQSACLSFLGR